MENNTKINCFYAEGKIQEIESKKRNKGGKIFICKNLGAFITT